MVSGFRCSVVIVQAPLASIATVPLANAVTPAAAAPDFRKLRRVTLARLSMVLMRVSSLQEWVLDYLGRLGLCFSGAVPLFCLANIISRFGGLAIGPNLQEEGNKG